MPRPCQARPTACFSVLLAAQRRNLVFESRATSGHLQRQAHLCSCLYPVQLPPQPPSPSLLHQPPPPSITSRSPSCPFCPQQPKCACCPTELRVLHFCSEPCMVPSAHSQRGGLAVCCVPKASIWGPPPNSLSLLSNLHSHTASTSSDVVTPLYLCPYCTLCPLCPALLVTPKTYSSSKTRLPLVSSLEPRGSIRGRCTPCSVLPLPVPDVITPARTPGVEALCTVGRAQASELGRPRPQCCQPYHLLAINPLHT